MQKVIVTWWIYFFCIVLGFLSPLKMCSEVKLCGFLLLFLASNIEVQVQVSYFIVFYCEIRSGFDIN